MKAYFFICILFISGFKLIGQNPGDLDSLFALNGKAVFDYYFSDDCSYCSVVQDDGKTILGGKSKKNSETDALLIRVEEDGAIDLTFGTDGKILIGEETSYEYISCLDIQPDGKIVLGIIIDNWSAIGRMNSDGSYDQSFGIGGWVSLEMRIAALKVQDNGKILGAGKRSEGYLYATLIRLESDGGMDMGFGVDGMASLGVYPFEAFNTLALQTSGKIIAGGAGGADMAASDVVIARFNSNGVLDTEFGIDGVIIDQANGENIGCVSIAIKPDNRILAGGYTVLSSGDPGDMAIFQYTSNGLRDSSFGDNGLKLFDYSKDILNSILLQPDGKIIIGGSCDLAGSFDFALIRCQEDGELDLEFGLQGSVLTDFFNGNDEITSVYMRDDGKLIATGMSYFTDFGDYDFAMARYFTGIYVGIIGSKDHHVENLVYMNPVIDHKIDLSYTLSASGNVTISLHTQNGQILGLLLDACRMSGSHHETLSLPCNLAPAYYLLNVVTGDQKTSVKMLVQ